MPLSGDGERLGDLLVGSCGASGPMRQRQYASAEFAAIG